MVCKMSSGVLRSKISKMGMKDFYRTQAGTTAKASLAGPGGSPV
jgi:hypothetical protein